MNLPLSAPRTERLRRQTRGHIESRYRERITPMYRERSELSIDTDRLITVLNELPPHLTEFVYARYEQDQSFTDISALLGVMKGVVRQYDEQLWHFLTYLPNVLRYVDDPYGIVRYEALRIVHAQDEVVMFASRAIENSTLTNEQVELVTISLTTLCVAPERSVLHLPIRPALYSYLHHHGIETLTDFERRGRKALRTLRGMGPKRLYDIEQLLSAEGITLTDEPRDIPRQTFVLDRPFLTKNDVVEGIRAVEAGRCDKLMLHRYSYAPSTLTTVDGTE